MWSRPPGDTLHLITTCDWNTDSAKSSKYPVMALRGRAEGTKPSQLREEGLHGVQNTEPDAPRPHGDVTRQVVRAQHDREMRESL